jgi:aldose 1-epimerase
MKSGQVLAHFFLGLVMLGASGENVAQANEPALSRLTQVDLGQTPSGERVQKTSLINELGMKIEYIDYACTITSIEVADSRGRAQNIVLNLPDLSSYLKTQRRYAAVIGRYAGRIAAGRYELNGRVYQLPINPNGAALHGDPNGFDKRVWHREDFESPQSLGSTFTLMSPDGDQGHPGNVLVHVTYELMKRANELRITYQATSDQPTVMTLTNHAFMNLAGAGSRGLGTHLFQVLADEYVQVNAKKLPSGRLLPVKGTPLDLNQPTDITPHLSQPSEMLGNPPGYDHTLALRQHEGQLQVAAVVHETTSGRTLTLKTTEPAIQFNTGNGFNQEEVGGEGVAYAMYDGFAMETFHYPDSPNHPEFPSTTVSPEKPYYSQTIYTFSASPDR